VKHLVDVVVRRLGLVVGDQFKADSRKMKFVVREVPADDLFPAFTDFDVVHHYLRVRNACPAPHLTIPKHRAERMKITYTIEFLKCCLSTTFRFSLIVR
jgi:hypothetical protein